MAPIRDSDDPGLRDIYLSNVPNKGLGKYTLFFALNVYYRIYFENYNKFV